MRNVFIYGVIGLFCMFLEIALFFLLSDSGINIILLNSLILVGLIFTSFNLNAFLNFNKKNFYGKRITKFYIVSFFGLCLSNIIIYFSMEHFDPNTSKIISILPPAIFQFLANKFWTFKSFP